MRLLLDTHAFVWTMTNRALLSSRARTAIADNDNDLLVSAVTAYEVDYKRGSSPDLARLPFDLDLARRTLRFDWLALSQSHATAAARLPRHHRDPWDRMLVAQAMAEEAVLVTVDERVRRYGVPVLW